MEFEKYTRSEVEENNYCEGHQRNIMAIIGNGFDIQALTSVGATTTTYKNFVNFISTFTNETNEKKISKDDFDILNKVKDTKLFRELKKDNMQGDLNWSDLELDVKKCVDKSTTEVELLALQKELEEIQYAFAIFLRNIITPQIIKKL